MNTLLESTIGENSKNSNYLGDTSNTRSAGYEYTRPSLNSFTTTSALRETTLSQESKHVKRRPLAPSKPPMRLTGIGMHRKANISLGTPE